MMARIVKAADAGLCAADVDCGPCPIPKSGGVIPHPGGRQRR